MARARGASLGAAVRALLEVVPKRTPRQQLEYVTTLKTGASKDSVGRQLGVTRSTINRWLAGTRSPSRRSLARLDQLFERFWRINHRVGDVPVSAVLRVSSRTPGAITVAGRPRTFITCEPGRYPRDWDALRNATTAEINARGGKLFIEAASVDVPYLVFGKGSFTIETL